MIILVITSKSLEKAVHYQQPVMLWLRWVFMQKKKPDHQTLWSIGVLEFSILAVFIRDSLLHAFTTFKSLFSWSLKKIVETFRIIWQTLSVDLWGTELKWMQRLVWQCSSAHVMLWIKSEQTWHRPFLELMKPPAEMHSIWMNVSSGNKHSKFT